MTLDGRHNASPKTIHANTPIWKIYPSSKKDLAVYKIIGELANLEIAEVCARSGANCGSLFLDLRFRELVRTLLADHPAHLDAASLAYFMHAFSETDKLAYMGESDDSESSLDLALHLRPHRGPLSRDEIYCVAEFLNHRTLRK